MFLKPALHFCLPSLPFYWERSCSIPQYSTGKNSTGKSFVSLYLGTYHRPSWKKSYLTKWLSIRPPNNESGKLQTRIDMGISSLTRLVRNFFIDILPLFANAIIALGAMFVANVYIGLVSLSIIPIYFYISNLQAKKLGRFRRNMRKFRETKNNGIISLIDSINVKIL